MFYLVTYDVAKDRRRKKMSDFLLEYGVRVQYSVFECDLTEKDVQAIMKKAEELIDPATDSVLIYPLCKNCVGKRIRIGTTYTLVKVKKDLLDLM
ncbi:MAG: hypothetical protein HBSAPP04_06250 [Ignavibacteriaceae bacterium]|nr:MAG: CRISPR-associated endonuclease Cas2 [Chlorobiota bacterium]GJQ31786.1 MAG: hypothetical protein HBSAPP04_06250 [Ignavibacteriaceae bacterium]